MSHNTFQLLCAVRFLLTAVQGALIIILIIIQRCQLQLVVAGEWHQLKLQCLQVRLGWFQYHSMDPP